MPLVRLALRRPITIVVAVISLMLCAALAVRRMPADIFPSLGAPAIYVAQPYGGMDPAQMEGYLTYYYEYHFLYITGIEHVESKNIQGAALMKLVFHPGTDMNQAIAQTVSYVNRARAFMPPGAVPPFIVRYDAGSVPVGQLVFSSDQRLPGEMQDFALNRVRPLFATLEGVSAPPPFGGNQRSIVVRLDPDRMRAYRISPEEAIEAVNRSSAVLPSGNVRTGDLARIAKTNAAIGGTLSELMDAPVRTGAGPSVYLKDLGTVENGTDIVTGYAHVNGKRTVYIPVTKRADASTLDVVERVKAALPAMRAVVPEDVKISFEFDQSGYVSGSIRGLVGEALLGAALTGLMVLLFLRDWRSALVVIATIPAALLGAVVGLWSWNQTMNIMTLGGLALAVGVLVDEATVEIENIHTEIDKGTPRAQAVVAAAQRTAVPRLLSLLCILTVFVPAFFMAGVARQLFVPLALAVAFAMITSYVLSSTLVPVLSAWLMRPSVKAGRDSFAGLRRIYGGYLEAVLRMRVPVALLYLAGVSVLLFLLYPRLGTEIFPTAGASQFKLRLRAPSGTRIERTELIALKALDVIRREAGPEKIAITTAFIGVQPASYPVNTIYLWTSGPHEAVLRVALKSGSGWNGEDLKERLRKKLTEALPDTRFSFEAGDIVSEVMSFGSPTPVEVAVQGPNLQANLQHAAKVQSELARIAELRDLQYAQPLDYPTLEVTVDRERAGQYGLTAAGIARSLVAATSSSRFTDPNYWRDPASGNAFQIQVEIPQSRMASINDVENLPVNAANGANALLGEVANVKYGHEMGEVDRYNMQRVISLTANIHDKPLGVVAERVAEAVKRAGAPPRGVTVQVRGQIPPLLETIKGLRQGVLLSVAAIFLLLAASFQSVRLALAVLVTIPAVLCGVVLMLLLTGTTLNIQSFLGSVMAVGIAVANSILLVTFAERHRLEGHTALEAIQAAGSERLRAILMTAFAMIAGMLPLALGLGESGEQAAPLGRAVAGGLLGATLATITVVPAFYALLQRRASVRTPALVAGALALLLLPARAQTPMLETATVVARNLDRKVPVTGEFLPFQSVELRARVSGYVEQVNVDRGSAVRKGQVLATLSAPEMMAKLAGAKADWETAGARKAEAQAKLVAAQSTYDRLKNASRTAGAIAGNELVQAEKAVSAAEAVVNSAETSRQAAQAGVTAVEDLIQYLKVTAPFDGVITERMTHPGALAGPSAEPLFRLEQVSRLRLVAAVPETEVGGIVRGARVRFRVPAFPGELFSGTVARLGRSMDQKTRTMPVEVEVANTSGKLAPGMFPEIDWPSKGRGESLLVPPSSVVTTTERTFIIRVRGGKAEWVNVRKGRPEGELVEIFGNLKGGDEIVRRGTDEIRDGSAVRTKHSS